MLDACWQCVESWAGVECDDEFEVVRALRMFTDGSATLEDAGVSRMCARVGWSAVFFALVSRSGEEGLHNVGLRGSLLEAGSDRWRRGGIPGIPSAVSADI